MWVCESKLQEVVYVSYSRVCMFYVYKKKNVHIHIYVDAQSG